MMSNAFTVRGHLIDIFQQTIAQAEVRVLDGRIAEIVPASLVPDQYILPGFIDAHVHIESSMLIPSEFARMAVVHGTVATVSDPHEIANVLGVEGVELMIRNGRSVPFKFYFGAPSCVPATPFETSGASIGLKEIEGLLSDPSIGYLAEMMNWPGVLTREPEVMQKIAAAQRLKKVIDGHAPGLRGSDAKAYADAGMSTDHECFSEAEALDKLSCGMKILIREGSAAKNFEALAGLLHEHWRSTMFCSDDKHPDSLEAGHINQLVARAVKKGVDLFKVLYAACINPVLHYGLDVGLLRPGDPADFIVVSDVKTFSVIETFVNGVAVASRGSTLISSAPCEILNRFAAQPVTAESLRLRARSENIRVIVARDSELITDSVVEKCLVRDGNAVADPFRDILKLVVINRYDPLAPPAIAFIRNFGLKSASIASSVAHDSHNIAAVGTDDALIARAVNRIVAAKGGISLSTEKEDRLLELPVAGLMSVADGYKVAREYQDLDQRAKKAGSTLSAPFMTLSFMALLVIPSLKLSDKGLFDGETFVFTDVFVAS